MNFTLVLNFIFLSAVIFSFLIEDINTASLYITFVFFIGVLVSFRGKFFNILQILLFISFIFGLSIPIFYSLNLYNYPPGNVIALRNHIDIPLSDQYVIDSYLIISFFLWGLIMSFYLMASKDKFIIRNPLFLFNTRTLFFVSVLLCILQLNTLVASQNLGYVESVHLSSGFFHHIGSLLLSIFPLIFLYSFVQNGFVSNPSLRKIIFICILFLLPYIILLIAGQRGPFFLAFVFTIYLFKEIFKIKLLGFVCFLVLFSLLFFTFHFIESYRFSAEAIDFEDLSNNLVDGVLFSSSSLSIVPYTIKFIDLFSNKDYFVFGYLTSIFSFSPNYSLSGIDDKSYLAQHLTFLLDPTRLLGGSTVGTNFIAELFEVFGYIYPLYFLAGFSLLALYVYLKRSITKSPLVAYFYTLFFIEFVYFSRGSPFKTFSKISLFWFLLFISLIFIMLFLKARQSR